MYSKCPRLNCVYVEYKQRGQTQKYTTGEKNNNKKITHGLHSYTCIGGCVGVNRAVRSRLLCKEVS